MASCLYQPSAKRMDGQNHIHKAIKAVDNAYRQCKTATKAGRAAYTQTQHVAKLYLLAKE